MHGKKIMIMIGEQGPIVIGALLTTIPAFALAIYDTIKGAEQTQNYDLMQKGLDWFSRNFTKQYMTLLD